MNLKEKRITELENAYDSVENALVIWGNTLNKRELESIHDKLKLIIKLLKKDSIL